MSDGTDLLALLPPFYREVLDYQEICKTEQEEFDRIFAAIHTIRDNFFFRTMDESSVREWEDVLRIVPDPVQETLDFRRQRVINRLSTHPPFTLGFLHQKLDELIGPGLYNVEVDYPNCTLYIESSAEDQSYASELAYTLHRIKPAHIVYINRPYLSHRIALSEEVFCTELQWNYRLGAWGLGQKPFVTLGETRMVKSRSVPSIQTAMLEAAAQAVARRIAAIRINGRIRLDAISTSVEGSLVTVTAAFSPEQAAVITQEELLDTEGAVLSAATVYVPVGQPVQLIYKLSTAEGG